ncbi:MAG TPA: hypothetical protein VKX49_16465 [Bryobacteraceae bacterium]|nr:hypothetical protein [Bryobacteraceae bacterium]
MADKLVFQTNIPVEVALKYGDGKDVTGQYGDQVLYTLTDGRVMYVPPIVRKQIEDLEIGRGELFTITKAEKKKGTRRTIEWQVVANGRTSRHRNGESIVENGWAVNARPEKQTLGQASGNGTVGPVAPGGASAQSLKQALALAVDAVAEGERYAGTHGISLQFTSEDVREIALRIYANASR